MGFFKELAGKVVETVVEHQPVIATVVLVGTIVATGIVIYKESPKIHKANDERKEDIADIKENEDMTEEEKETEIKEINKEFLNKVKWSIAKIGAMAFATFVGVAAINFTHAALTSACISGYEIAKQKNEIYETVVKDKAPEKADDIRSEVEKQVAEVMKKYQNDTVSDYDPENLDRTGKVEIYDEFGNTWVGYYVDVTTAVNEINEYILDGDDPTLNLFYSFIPGCKKTVFGRTMVFPHKRGKIRVEPKAELDTKTGKLVRIMIQYGRSPVFGNSEAAEHYRDERVENRGDAAREYMFRDGSDD